MIIHFIQNPIYCNRQESPFVIMKKLRMTGSTKVSIISTIQVSEGKYTSTMSKALPTLVCLDK